MDERAGQDEKPGLPWEDKTVVSNLAFLMEAFKRLNYGVLCFVISPLDVMMPHCRDRLYFIGVKNLSQDSPDLT